MEFRRGKSLVDQIAAGPLFFHRRPNPPVSRLSNRSAREESARFFTAQQRAVDDLSALHGQASSQLGPDAAAIFAIHAMLAEDEDLVDAVREHIYTRGATAEWAVLTVSLEYAQALAALDDPYMQARAADIQDVARQLLKSLVDLQSKRPDRPCLLVADRFLPSEIMCMKGQALGLVSLNGSPDSHTAMLLRAFRIPTLIGLDLDESWDGHPALLDGYTGTLYLDPDHSVSESLRLLHQADGIPAGAAL